MNNLAVGGLLGQDRHRYNPYSKDPVGCQWCGAGRTEVHQPDLTLNIQYIIKVTVLLHRKQSETQRKNIHVVEWVGRGIIVESNEPQS